MGLPELERIRCRGDWSEDGIELLRAGACSGSAMPPDAKSRCACSRLRLMRLCTTAFSTCALGTANTALRHACLHATSSLEDTRGDGAAAACRLESLNTEYLLTTVRWLASGEAP